MDHGHNQRIRHGLAATLAGALAVPVLWTIAPLTADAVTKPAPKGKNS